MSDASLKSPPNLIETFAYINAAPTINKKTYDAAVRNSVQGDTVCEQSLKNCVHWFTVSD